MAFLTPRFLILSLKSFHQCHSRLAWDKFEQNSHSCNSQGLKNIWTAETWCALDLAVVRSQCVNGHLCSGVNKGQGGSGRKKSEDHPSEAAKKRQGMSHSPCPQFTYILLLRRHEKLSWPDFHREDSEESL